MSRNTPETTVAGQQSRETDVLFSTPDKEYQSKNIFCNLKQIVAYKSTF